MRRALLAFAFGMGATGACAWPVAPPQYIDVATAVILDWPQWRLQDECAAVSLEAVDGHRILACTWTALGLCFIAVDRALGDPERDALIRLHELPHCAGWAWNHPHAVGEYRP